MDRLSRSIVYLPLGPQWNKTYICAWDSAVKLVIWIWKNSSHKSINARLRSRMALTWQQHPQHLLDARQLAHDTADALNVIQPFHPAKWRSCHASRSWSEAAVAACLALIAPTAYTRCKISHPWRRTRTLCSEWSPAFPPSEVTIMSRSSDLISGCCYGVSCTNSTHSTHQIQDSPPIT